MHGERVAREGVMQLSPVRVRLDPKTIDALRQYAKVLGKSVDEIVQDGINLLLSSEDPDGQ